MKKTLPVVLLALFALTGCSVSSHPVAISGGAVGTKEGRATAKRTLGLITTGNNRITAAARNGGITKISTVDDSGNEYAVLWGLIYSERTTYVTGE